MVRTIAIRLAVAIFVSAIGAGTTHAFGLDKVVARMIGDHPNVVVGVIFMISGVIGLIGLCFWIVLRLDEKLLSPRPRLGSLVYRDIVLVAATPPMLGTPVPPRPGPDIQIVVTLVNENPELVSYFARLTGAVNGKQWRNRQGQSILEFEDCASAATSTELIMRIPDIPFEVTNGFVPIAGTIEYELKYFYVQSVPRTRTTRRAIDFDTIVPTRGEIGTIVLNNIHVLFRNQRER